MFLNIVICILQNNGEKCVILLGSLNIACRCGGADKHTVKQIIVNPISMEIIDFSKSNSIINKYMAEMRDKDYQGNRLLFRNNIMRVGELIAYELSKTFDYEERDIETPLGVAKVNVPTDRLVLGTIFRAGLPFHQGFLNIFDHAGNAFVSATANTPTLPTPRWEYTLSISPRPT